MKKEGDSGPDTGFGERSSDAPSQEFYAHTLPDRPVSDWQLLEVHLSGVADGAARFAAAFDAEEWGHVAGMWHDLGKYSEAFQAYLRDAASPDVHTAEYAAKIDHSSAGAQHAVRQFPIIGHLLASAIAGHHSGLLDTLSDGACLAARLEKEIEPWDGAPSRILSQPELTVPPALAEALGRKDRHKASFAVQFFARMLFSCLVDADFLDTEAFMSPRKAAGRPVWPADVLGRMEQALTDFVGTFRTPSTDVDRARAHVRQACLAAAAQPPGLFSLTVPTGGGKTLSSLAFALRHAMSHGLRRIVYVVPFTSIIEQNAGVFREVLAPLLTEGLPDPVIEHHSNLDPDEESTASRLATENWDAPLVVTTSVQFYESLFANRTSRCRKLHNLARSVVILDEAQALPVDYLEPCLRALEELSAGYGTSIVLCTATQPAVRRRDNFPIGITLPAEREIIPDPPRLYESLQRVRVELENRVVEDSELASRLLDEDRVLCIVNTRGHALRLAGLLGQRDGHFHLSALMCPEHRSQTLNTIRSRLDSGSVCRVVSTQLIEAGVDIDFPVVYRSMAGLDSIAQAAGRCNRNGRRDSGRTVVFDSEHRSSEVFLRDTAQSAREVLPLHGEALSLEAVDHYFRLYYWDQSSRWDAKKILDEFRLQQDRDLPFLFGFARAAARFRLIQDVGRGVIIPWGEEGEALCRELRDSWEGPSVKLRRKLQRYVVQVPMSVWRRHGHHAFEILHDQYPVLTSPELHYSDWTGLNLDADLIEALTL